MHRPPPAEGNDLERLLNLPPNTNPSVQAPPPNVPVWPDEQAAAFCAVAPPIETFMDVPDEIRRDQFYAVSSVLVPIKPWLSGSYYLTCAVCD